MGILHICSLRRTCSQVSLSKKKGSGYKRRGWQRDGEGEEIMRNRDGLIQHLGLTETASICVPIVMETRTCCRNESVCQQSVSKVNSRKNIPLMQVYVSKDANVPSAQLHFNKTLKRFQNFWVFFCPCGLI